MPSPRPQAPPDAHARHDPLLVAQLAAGDPLDPTERERALSLVSTCPHCAELAADLRAVSRAVAWEPQPPRRRDFRLDAERAARLRGSRWSRFLRRLSPPAAGALRPAAAGVLSLGLLLVIAGSAWPAPEATPAGPPAAPATTVGPVPARDARQAETLADEAPAEEAPANVESGAPEGRLQVDDVMAMEAPAADAEVSPAEAFAAAPSEAAALADGVQEGDTSNKAANDSPEVPRRSRAVEQATELGLGGDVRSPVPGATATAAVGGAFSGEGSTPASESSAAGQESVTVKTAGQGPDIATLLLGTGMVLVAAGALALLLGWLSRRASDPLLR